MRDVQQLLSDALYNLEQWAKSEVTDVGYINRAYRDILEAAAKLRASGRAAEAEKLEKVAGLLQEAETKARSGHDNPSLLEVYAGFMAVYALLKSLASLGLYVAKKLH